VGSSTGNTVTFSSIPIDAPSAGFQRIFRITNLRANATAVGASLSLPIPLYATIATSGAASFALTNNPVIVGFATPALITSSTPSASLDQCVAQTRTAVATLSFTESFGSAFKTRVAAQSNLTYAGQTFPIVVGEQDVPGTVYFTTSNFIAGLSGGTAGLADFGTRLRANFRSIPPGVRIYVSVYNVVNENTPAPIPAIPGGSDGNVRSASVFAQLVTSETGSDGIQPSVFPFVSPTNLAPGLSGQVPAVELPVINGVATAVWEVINTSITSIETLRFAVYASYAANPASNFPAPGTATVDLGFAPAPPAFAAGEGAVASSTLPLPRYVDTGSPFNLLTINRCSVNIGVAANPPGLPVIVDGQTVQSPQTFNWVTGSTHTLQAISPQPNGSGSRYAFANWSNGGQASQTIQVPTNDSTFTANYTQQFQLTTNVSPAGSGSISAGGWFDAGTVVPVSATPISGFQFANFSGALSGISNPQNIVMSAAKNVVANFASLSPVLGAAITARSGPAATRLWTITLTNSGPGIANAAGIDGITLTQTGGAACSSAPSITSTAPSPTSPLVVGALAPTATASTGVTFDFSGCSAAARFRVSIGFRANGGAYAGSTVLNNQFY
jgi:hypothetical protein